MKTSKFFLSTLIAASAMTATAYAGYVWNGGETITQELWQTENSWTLTDGATWPVSGTGPLTPGSNVWSGVTVSNASGSVDTLEGWALGLTLTNTNLTVGTLMKFQGGGIITMDADSTLTVSSFGGGNDGGTITLNNEGVFNLAYAKNQGGDGFIASLGATGIMNLTSADGNAYTAKIKSLSAVLGTTEETVIKDGLTFSNYRNLVTLGDGISFDATSTKLSFVDTSGAEITFVDKKIVAAGDGSYNVTLSEGWVLFEDSGYSVGYTSGKVFDQTVFIWSGEDGATWNTTDTTWKTSASGSAEAFSAGESVVFNKNASVVVGEGINSAFVAITDNSTLSLSGQSNLSAVSIQIDGGSKLDLGNLADGQNVNHVLTGTGTVSISKSTGNHNSDVNLGTKFAGTVNYSGNLNYVVAVLGSDNAKLNFTNVFLWSTGTGTFNQDIVFAGTNNYFDATGGGAGGGTLNLNGDISWSDGAKLTLRGGTLNLGGNVTLSSSNFEKTAGNLNITGGHTTFTDSFAFDGSVSNGATLEFAGGESTISSTNCAIKGNLVIGKGATVTGTATDGLNYNAGSATAQSMTVAGELILKARWTAGTYSPITIDGGTISGWGMGNETESDVALDFHQSTTLSVTGANSVLDAVARVKGGNTLTINVAENADLTVSKSMSLNYYGGVSSIVKDGLGDLTIDASNNGEANFTVTAGQLSLKKDNSFNTLSVQTNGTLVIDGEATATVVSLQASEGTVTVNNGSVLKVTSAARIGTLSGEGTVLYDGVQNATGAGKPSFATGAAKIQFRNAAGYMDKWNGEEVVADIELIKSMSEETEQSAFAWNNGSSQSTPTITFSGALSGDGTFEKTNDGVRQCFVFSGDTSAFTGKFLHTGSNGKSTLTFGNDTKSGVVLNEDATIAWDNSTNVTFNYSNDVEAKGTISGATLVKSGEGKLTLSGDNSYSGGTTIEAGTLVAAHASALGTGAVTVATDAKLGLVAGTTVTDVTGGIALSDGAKLVIDLSSKVGETETFTLDLITGTTITFGETSLASNSTNIADTWYELSGWDKDGWASTLNYDSASQTLSLTMTIPEPSAFGLLAGVGALALVASRRRRSRR